MGTVIPSKNKPKPLSFGDKFMKNLRLSFLRTKHFWGDYASCTREAKQFYAHSSIGIIPVKLIDSKLQLMLSLPQMMKEDDKMDVETAKAIMKEEARQHGRELRKEHKMTLYYVHDFFLTRLLGWKHGRLTMQLANYTSREERRPFTLAVKKIAAKEQGLKKAKGVKLNSQQRQDLKEI